MLPPVIRRCPDCGYVSLSVRFPGTLEDGRLRVTCPACGHEFEPPDTPRLA
jgi:endogenous inhibitor of DNA gyrase (YacG/DUF329 family)